MGTIKNKMPSAAILPQLVINGLIAGSIYALAASGFSLVYYVVKFQYFSHGAIMAVAAYLFFAFLNIMGINYILAVFLTIIGSIIATLLTNWLVYKQLRKRKATPTTSLITSVVLLIFLSSLILAIFGSSTKTISLSNYNKTFDFDIFTITLIQITIIISVIILFLFLWFIFKRTKTTLNIDYIKPNGTLIFGVVPATVVLEAKTSGGVDGKATCKLFGSELQETFGTIHKQTFNQIFSGNYEFPIICTDSAGNEASSTTSFTAELDVDSPRITRAYNKDNNLIIATDENAKCAFVTQDKIGNCNFEFSNATMMSGEETIHTTSFDKDSYYIK